MTPSLTVSKKYFCEIWFLLKDSYFERFMDYFEFLKISLWNSSNFKKVHNIWKSALGMNIGWKIPPFSKSLLFTDHKMWTIMVLINGSMQNKLYKSCKTKLQTNQRKIKIWKSICSNNFHHPVESYISANANPFKLFSIIARKLLLQ